MGLNEVTRYLAGRGSAEELRDANADPEPLLELWTRTMGRNDGCEHEI